MRGSAASTRSHRLAVACARAVALSAAAVCVATPAAAATRPVPLGFMGTNAAGPLFEGQASLPDEVGLMKRTNVESIRFAMAWGDMQPYRSRSEIPAGNKRHFEDKGGVPTDFSQSDRVVTQAAKRGLRITAVLLKAPPWAAAHPETDHSQPTRSAYPALARFAAVLVHRYGTKGDFWAMHPKLRRLPIVNWQPYNEPNIKFYWDQPFAKSYVAMLAKVAHAIRAADSHARVVLAAMTNQSWTALKAVYAAGGRPLFDAAATNPFSRKPSDVVQIVERDRDAMKEGHDGHKPILVTEMSWTSAEGEVSQPFGWETTEAGQADKLRRGYELFAAARCRLRIESVFWETWITWDREDYSFDYAGLREASASGGEPRSKPALAAYADTARKLEQRGKNRAARARCP